MFIIFHIFLSYNAFSASNKQYLVNWWLWEGMVKATTRIGYKTSNKFDIIYYLYTSLRISNQQISLYLAKLMIAAITKVSPSL